MRYPVASSSRHGAYTLRSEPSILISAVSPKKSPVALLFAFALVIPYIAAIYIGDIKLTPIKILILLFAPPAATYLLAGVAKKERRLMASDVFALTTSICLILIPLEGSGEGVLVGTVSQAIEFFGSYLIGRVFFFGNGPIRDFARALRIVTITIVALGALDILQQRYVAHEFVQLFFPPGERPLVASDPHFHRELLGVDTIRAASTFDHPILFGSFCAVVAAIHLYSDRTAVTRFFHLALCLVGCLASMSSASLLALFAIVALFSYDALLRTYRWRWKLLCCVLLTGICALFITSENPASWLFRNLTLDPQTSYFRLLIWDAAINQISNHPWFGIGFHSTGNQLLDNSTDSLWLAKAVTYGLSTIALLFLTGLASVIPIRGQADIRQRDPVLDRMCTSFSIVLAAITFISITCYFWNAVWLFSILCIGIRVTLKEQCLLARKSPRSSDLAYNDRALSLRRAAPWATVSS